jgi:hypothetical protein
MMKKLVYFVCFVLSANFLAAQGEDVGVATVFNPTQSCSLSATSCTGANYNLGASTSPQAPAAGTMANDAWFSFTAPATVVKVRVCPNGFDAGVEVRSADGNTLITSFNNSASGVKEVSCVTGLTYGAVYTVRVGRVSGTGAATFQMNIEHHAVSVANNFYPGPAAGFDCYLSGNSIQRNLPCVGMTYAQTRFFFDGVGIPDIGPYTTAGGQAFLGFVSTAWISGGSYDVYIEVQVNDAECGLLWFGYSIPRTINFCSVCDLPWTGSSINPNNQTLSSICTNFSIAPFYGNYQFRYRFQTNNGATEFCSNWATGDLVTCGSVIFDCLRYNRTYAVSFGARLVPSDPVCWYGPTNIITPAMPYANVNSAECCKWRNGNGGFIQGTIIPGYDQYRFRLTPIDPCNPNNPLAPIGPSITTGWGSGSLLNPNGITIPGTVYLVQEQGRILSNNCPSCSGVSLTIPAQQTDWGSICIIGIRSSASPAVGTPIGCYCSPGMNLPFEELDLTYDQDYATANKTAIATIQKTGHKIVTIDLSASETMGIGVIEMRNLAGQLVLSKAVRAGEEQVEIQLNELPNMSTGIYVLTVKTEVGLFTEKLFIQF